MEVVHQLVLLTYLMGFAALLGGGLTQLRDPEPEINGAMLHGAWVQLAAGVALWVLTPDVPLAGTIVQTVITAFLTVLVVRNRRYLSVPRGLLFLIVGLAVVCAAIGVVVGSRQ